MRTLAWIALPALALTPMAATAQDWSPEQREVWEFELSCQDSKEAWLGCFHPDYVAWSDMTHGVPLNRADHVAMGGEWWDTNEQLSVHLKPLEIMVRGDFAVALVLYVSTTRNRATGEITTTSEAWTDVLVKENGRWYWIADHGTAVGPG